MGFTRSLLHLAFVLLIVFGYLWRCCRSPAVPDEPRRGFSAAYIGSVAYHSILPLLSLVLGHRGWFMGWRALVSNIVTEDYVAYAELGGVSSVASCVPTSCATRWCRR